MFKNSTLTDLVISIVKEFEKDLTKFNYKKFFTEENLKNFETMDKSTVLHYLSNALHKFVSTIPDVNMYRAEKCYRFNHRVEELNNHRTTTIYGIKHLDQECESYEAYSLIFTTFKEDIESFKLEITSKEEEALPQVLNFRLMCRNNGEITLEFFKNSNSKNELIIKCLQSLSKVKQFEFNKQITFALGGVITQSKEL